MYKAARHQTLIDWDCEQLVAKSKVRNTADHASEERQIWFGALNLEICLQSLFDNGFSIHVKDVDLVSSVLFHSELDSHPLVEGDEKSFRGGFVVVLKSVESDACHIALLEVDSENGVKMNKVTARGIYTQRIERSARSIIN